MKRSAVLLLTALALSACGPTASSSAPAQKRAGMQSPPVSQPTSTEPSPTRKADPTAPLRKAVQAYSDAFLTGKVKAYNLLSDRCRAKTDRSYFIGILAAARSTYGSALPIKTFKADVQGTLAHVTYTYELTAINQSDQPWIKESGHWHDDRCP